MSQHDFIKLTCVHHSVKSPHGGNVVTDQRTAVVFQVSKGKPLKFKRLEDFLKESHKKHRDETRIHRAEKRPPPSLPPAKHKLAFAVRIRE